MTIYARGLAGQMSFDGTTIRITRKGFFPFILHGSGGTKNLNIKSITAVQHRRCGFFSGYLQLSVQGELEHGSGKANPNSSLMQDENTIVFYFVANNAFQILADTLNNAIRDLHSGKAQPTADEALQQIGSLGTLRDLGHISSAEYETKKAELLARI
jgi:hypothetical protein